MNKIDAKAQAHVEFSVKFQLTVNEAKALEAIVGYGIEQFLDVFYKHLGKAYLSPFESDLKLLFDRVKKELPGEVYKIETAQKAIDEALKDLK